MKTKKDSPYNTTLFIFRRDLRLQDNTGLNQALQQSQHVIPCFIFDPQQITDKNKYYSTHAVQFMIESLQSLHKELQKHNSKLYLFYDSPKKILKNIFASIHIDAVFINKDYTPFSIARDATLEKLCVKNNVAFHSYDDALLNSPTSIHKKDKSIYSVFTAFYKNACHFFIKKPHTVTGTLYNKPIPHAESEKIYSTILKKKNTHVAVHGGRSSALKTIKNLSKFTHYERYHDYPTHSTSHLSAHLKFGTVSIREAYHAIVTKLGHNHLLIRQLYWRDFFYYIAFHNPTVFGHPYRKKYENLSWNNSKQLFHAWCTGTTGFPIVDAGMRELNKTGFMHNRVRMIVASFLVKDLHINWLWGEKYFAQKLIDYDPAVNNGNWQWCASTGCDAQPYFRIFNPWLQQKKYDSDCTYIKTWIPELKNIPSKLIHVLFKKNSPLIEGYPKPIVDHTKESVLAKRLYKTV